MHKHAHAGKQKPGSICHWGSSHQGPGKSGQRRLGRAGVTVAPQKRTMAPRPQPAAVLWVLELVWRDLLIFQKNPKSRLLPKFPGPTQLWERVLQGCTAKGKRQAAQATSWTAPPPPPPPHPWPHHLHRGLDDSQLSGAGRGCRSSGLQASRRRLRGGGWLIACMPGF